MQEQVNRYLCQRVEERSTAEETYANLLQLKQEAAQRLAASQSAPAPGQSPPAAAQAAARAQPGVPAPAAAPNP